MKTETWTKPDILRPKSTCQTIDLGQRLTVRPALESNPGHLFCSHDTVPLHHTTVKCDNPGVIWIKLIFYWNIRSSLIIQAFHVGPMLLVLFSSWLYWIHCRKAELWRLKPIREPRSLSLISFTSFRNCWNVGRSRLHFQCRILTGSLGSKCIWYLWVTVM